MGYRFAIVKRVCDNEALIAFIDLLGTRKLYESPLIEKQAQKILDGLMGQFDIKFADHFRGIEQNFDVSIFADSIVISERRRTPNIIERLVDFLLSYQSDLLLNLDLLSRAIVTKDSFFSFKVTDASPDSILGSPHTSVSLCGGRSIKLLHDHLTGLPMGVYVAKTIENDLSAEQKERVVGVRNDEHLVFLKQKYDVLNFLLDTDEKTLGLLTRKPNADNKAIRDSLRACHPDEDRVKKVLPWALVHLGRQKEIVRCGTLPKKDRARSRCSS
jgi:hypothetical protein